MPGGLLHEYTIASNISRSLLEYVEKTGANIVGVKVYVGEITLVDRRLLVRSLKTLLKGTRLENCRVRSYLVRGVFKCEDCGKEWGFKDVEEELVSSSIYSGEDPPFHYLGSLIYSFMTCPNCGGINYRVVSGKTIEYRVVIEG